MFEYLAVAEEDSAQILLLKVIIIHINRVKIQMLILATFAASIII